jgi:hypothetical protein
MLLGGENMMQMNLSAKLYRESDRLIRKGYYRELIIYDTPACMNQF